MIFPDHGDVSVKSEYPFQKKNSRRHTHNQDLALAFSTEFLSIKMKSKI